MFENVLHPGPNLSPIVIGAHNETIGYLCHQLYFVRFEII